MTITSELVISSEIGALTAYADARAKDFLSADVFRLQKGMDETIGVAETVAFMEMAHLSSVGENKLMIIFDVAKMTAQSQNKILKTIEDAPAKTKFLLLATTDNTILNTVKSRCVTKYLPLPRRTEPLVSADIVKTLREVFGLEFDENALNISQKHDIMQSLGEYNRRVTANCNATNQKDLIIMEILKICARQ